MNPFKKTQHTKYIIVEMVSGCDKKSKTWPENNFRNHCLKSVSSLDKIFSPLILSSRILNIS